MRTVYFVCVFLALVSSATARNEYTIDFTESFGMDAFAEAGVPLEIPPSVVKNRDPGRRWFPVKARYIFKLPSSNTLIFEANRGHVAFAFQDKETAGRLVLYGNDSLYYLTIEEAFAVLEQFHDAFEIPKGPLIDWFEPIKEGLGARGYYQAGARTNYPRITLEAANSFFDDTPVFLNLIISFNQASFKRLGLTAETNNVRNLTFDIPSIIESVRASNTETKTAQTPEELPIIAPEGHSTEPAAKESRSTEPAPTESSQWWLWLIGAFVVLIGVVILCRKIKLS